MKRLKMKIKYFIFSVPLFYSSSLSAASLRTGEAVVCIHEILGAPWMMKYIARGFQDEGMWVTNWGYPSRDKRIEEHALDLVAELRQIAEKTPGHPIHFVAHSMGGLVLRAAIAHPDCPEEAKMGRAVLIAPPNQGAAWGRFLEQFSLAKKIAKEEAGRQLMTERNFEHLGNFPSTMSILVIAGNLSYNPFLKGSERWNGCRDGDLFDVTPHQHVVIRAEHKTIVFSKKALNLARSFIAYKLTN